MIDLSPDPDRLSPSGARYEHRATTTALILHATEGSPDETVEEIREYHMTDPGRLYIDVGYHYLIRHGVVLPGRPVWAVGSHAFSKKIKRGWNHASIGIALVGNYPLDPPPEAQLAACTKLVLELIAAFPGVLVMSHKEAMARIGDPDHTDCPGGPWVEEIRRRIAQGMRGDDRLYQDQTPA